MVISIADYPHVTTVDLAVSLRILNLAIDFIIPLLHLKLPNSDKKGSTFVLSRNALFCFDTVYSDFSGSSFEEGGSYSSPTNNLQLTQ